MITLFAPLVLIAFALIAMTSGLPVPVAVLFTVIVLAVGGYFLKQGVDHSCLINESECIGATATAYLFGGLWLISALILAFSAILILGRRRS